VTITAPIAADSTGTSTGSMTSTLPIAITVDQGAGSSLPSTETRPLVTITAPINGNAATGTPATDTTATSPLDVVVGQGTTSNAGGSLVDVNTPVNADGSTVGSTGSGVTSLPLINLSQDTAPLSGTSGTGSLVDVNTPVNVDGATTATPVGTGVTSLPLINLGQDTAPLSGTSGTGSLVSINTAPADSGPIATPGTSTVS